MNQEEQPTPARYIELGARHAANGEPDLAIHFYNLALRSDCLDIRANLRLAEACEIKAEGRRRKRFLSLGVEALRRALRREPLNKAAHDKLLVLSYKAGKLDELAHFYGGKIREGADAEFYEACLKQAEAMSLLGSEVRRELYRYTPSPFVRIFFEKFLLPGATLTILASHIGPKTRPFFGLGTTMFSFYCFYRAGLYLATRKD